MRKLFIAISAVFWFGSCSESDDLQLPSEDISVMQKELQQLRSSLKQLETEQQALNLGFRPAGQYSFKEQVMLLEHEGRMDAIFNHIQPEGLFYLKGDDNIYRLAGAAFRVRMDQEVRPNLGESKSAISSYNTATPPKGFTGVRDIWMANDETGYWELHVWTEIDHPLGVFSYDLP